MIVEVRQLPYEDRLQNLRLMSLVTRRLRENMLEVFKILNGFDNIDREHFLVYSRSTLRSIIRNNLSLDVD